MPTTHAGWFKLVAVAEAISWAALLISMGFKYGLGMPTGVTVCGWIHGVIFTAYVVTTLIVFSPLRWKFPVLLLALLASVPPLASVVFERWAARRGLMDPAESDEPTFWGRFAGAVREIN